MKKRKSIQIVLPVLGVAASCLFAGGLYAAMPVVAEAVDKVAYTYVLGEGGTNTQTEFYYDTNYADGWNAAIARSLALRETENWYDGVTVKLADDWTANEIEGGNTTSFGLGEGFFNGQLYVPSRAYVILDLNGFWLDRGLTEFEPQEHGSVIRSDGFLRIEDGNPNASRPLGDDAFFLGGAITGGNATQGGGVCGNVDIYGGSIAYNNATQGGGVYGGASMSGGSIVHNTAEQGGGVYSDILHMVSGSISYNTAEQGGGLFCFGSGAVIAEGDAVIANNTASLYGGGVYCSQRCTFAAEDNTSITNNKAKRGGGIYCEADGGSADAIIDGSASVTGNRAEQGGGIYCADGSNIVMVDNASVTGNTATQGGGIYCANGSELSIYDNASVTNNTATQGDGIYQSEEAVLFLEGSPQIHENVLYMEAGAVIRPRYLEDAYIFISCDEGVPFTSDYLKYNKADKVSSYAASPVEWFFTADNRLKPVVNAEGELVFVDAETHPLTWNVSYQSGGSGGNSESEARRDEYGVTLTYGDYTVTNVSLNGLPLLSTPVSDANEYSISHSFSDVTVCFTVAILPRELTDEGVTCAIEDDQKSFEFTGGEITPKVVLVYGGKELEEGTDYLLEYKNIINVGTAEIRVSGLGNFGGERILNFNVAPPKGLTYAVTWEALGENGWAPYTAQSFYFNMTDFKQSLRARLTADFRGTTVTEFVYYDAPTTDAANWNENLHLAFDRGEVVSAGDYTVTIGGNPNGPLDSDSTTVTINAAVLQVNAGNFSAYEDARGNRLWLLAGGERLQGSGTKYFDPSAPADEYGNNYATGTLDDSYASFRGEGAVHELVLNGDYLLDGVPLSAYLPYLTVEYGGSNRATGKSDGVVTVNTQVRLTFDHNFALSGGSNTLTLNKTWYIVFINNALVNTDGSPLASALGDVTFGNADMPVFRPQYGNEVVYLLEGETAFRFAAVFENGGSEPAFYGVRAARDADGAWRVNYSERLADDYLNRSLNRLSAGNYTLTVYVPRQETENVVHYAFTQSFTFRVMPRSIEEDGEFVSGASYFLLETEVDYNGGNNNTPKISFSLDRKTLREGVDYVLTSESVNVGAAELAVRGIGNYAGTVYLGSEIYSIVRATNVWVYTPSVFAWNCQEYERAVNRFQASPRLLDAGKFVWFGVFYDEEGNESVAGLGAFTAENGLVSDGIAERLNALPAGNYYVKATVEGTDNYTGLNPAPNLLTVGKTSNSWVQTPSVIGWRYREYDKTSNLILASVRHGSLTFVLKDGSGKELTRPFALTQDGTVPDEVAAVFLALPVGTYSVTAIVSSGDYADLDAQTATFAVTQAVNAWTLTPGIYSWVTGEYSETENIFYAEAKFGNVRFRITLADDENYVIFDTEREIDLLKEAKAGTYVLSAYVADGARNYSDLSPFMVTFRVFPPAGMPWWGTLLIVVGVLGVLAVVFLILQKKGVLQVISGKMMIAIRTKAAADATIAAVRANKRAEEAKLTATQDESEDGQGEQKEEE